MNPEFTAFSPFNIRDELKHIQDVDKLKEIQHYHSLPFSVAVYNNINDFNLAGVIRNACIFGFRTVYIIGTRKYDRRGTVGAHHYVDIVHHPTFDDFLNGTDDLVKAAFEVPEHYPDIKHDFESLYNMDYYDADCLLFGLEGSGIPREHLEECEYIVTIPQRGIMRSLNTAVASGIAMSHWINKYNEAEARLQQQAHAFVYPQTLNAQQFAESVALSNTDFLKNWDFT